MSPSPHRDEGLPEVTHSLRRMARALVGDELARTVRRIDLGSERELHLLPADYRLRLDAADSIREIHFTVWPDEPLEVDLAGTLAVDRASREGAPPDTNLGDRR